jgi:hypothetical protein
MAADKDALNYPYIRVRSVDWLKRTLLIFPHVVRMTPAWGAPADDPEISAFMNFEGRRGPLLRAADLQGTPVHKAQHALIEELRSRIEVDGSTFRNRFGRQATEIRSADFSRHSDVWDRRLLDRTFQIHTYKLLEELTAFLTYEDLAWEPAPELADGTNYIEMHPALGEAIMATLAMACAENEGLQVVTEFPELHGKLLGVPREKILAATFDDDGPGGGTSGQQIAEFLVYRCCDVDLLSAEAIAGLQDERQALADFRTKIDELAATLPETIHSQKHREQYLSERVSDLLGQWKQDQANFGPKGRRFFGEGLLSEPGKFAEKMVEAAVIGTVTSGTVLGAGAGFGVAVVFHGVESAFKARREAKNGPLRYLTKLQDQGVSFSVAP